MFNVVLQLKFRSYGHHPTLHIYYSGIKYIPFFSVADPEPEDPYAFGHPGSGSISTRFVGMQI
jgi:hypothetical protein